MSYSKYTIDQFKASVPNDIYIASGGTVYSNGTDSGTWGSGYDYVGLPETHQNIIKHLAKKALYDNNVRKAFLKCFKLYQLLNPDITDKKMLREQWKKWVVGSALIPGLIFGGYGLYNAYMNYTNLPPSYTNNVSQRYSDTFISYIKRVENAKCKGWNSKKQLWFPHKSPEGGFPTIGYGHKISSEQELKRCNKGLTDSDVNNLLLNDLMNAERRVYSDLNDMIQSKKITIPADMVKDGKLQLSTQQIEMLIDYAFNVGTIKKFPKFTNALINNDMNGIESEYIRKAKIGGKYVPIARNKDFYDTFINRTNTNSTNTINNIYNTNKNK